MTNLREEVKRILFYEFGTYKKDATVEHATDLILSLLHPISEEEIEKIILNTCVQNSAKGIYVVDYENRILHSEILAHVLSSRLLGGKCCECKEPRPKDSDLICANCDRKIKPTQSQIEELKIEIDTDNPYTLGKAICELTNKTNEVIRTINREG